MAASPDLILGRTLRKVRAACTRSRICMYAFRAHRSSSVMVGAEAWERAGIGAPRPLRRTTSASAHTRKFL